MELAQVRDARVRGEVRTQVVHALGRGDRLVVPSQLDERIDDHALRRGTRRPGRDRPPAPVERGGEVVSREGEAPRGNKQVRIEGRRRERDGEQRVRFRVIGGIAGLPSALEIGRREPTHRMGVVRGPQEASLRVVDGSLRGRARIG